MFCENIQEMSNKMENKQTFRITGMDCASCAQTVENGVTKLDGCAGRCRDFPIGDAQRYAPCSVQCI